MAGIFKKVVDKVADAVLGSDHRHEKELDDEIRDASKTDSIRLDHGPAQSHRGAHWFAGVAAFVMVLALPAPRLSVALALVIAVGMVVGSVAVSWRDARGRVDRAVREVER